jgi:hypothetical protein
VDAAAVVDDGYPDAAALVDADGDAAGAGVEGVLTSSRTTEAGRSTTSPAAMSRCRWAGRR